MSIEEKNSEFAHGYAHQQLQEYQQIVKERVETETISISAKQRRNERYAKAVRLFERFDELNHNYQEALQRGDGGKVAELIAQIQENDLRAEAERLQKEADALYIQEKADEDARERMNIAKVRAAMASVANRQAA